MTQYMVTEQILNVFEEAKRTPDEYINPNYLSELLDIIESYNSVDEDRLDELRDYITELYEL